MKKDKKGFTLIETLVVSTVIIAIIVFLFAQFSKLRKSYEASFKNNNIIAIYNTRNINRYLISINYYTITTSLKDDGINYIDITTCPDEYIMNSDYCKKLFDFMGVQSVFIVKENELNPAEETSFKKFLKENPEKVHAKFYRFVKTLAPKSDNTGGYRIIAEYKDDLFAALKFSF